MTEQEYRQTFREAEANLLLEGLEPSERDAYKILKARIIAGEITALQARQQITHYHQHPHP